MARSFKLPDLGEGIHEAEISEVLVSPGDEIEEGDPILVVETDKASVEIPSPYTGTVQEVRVEAGDQVRVGDLMMTFSGGEEEEVEAPAAEEGPPEEAEPEASAAEEVTPEEAEPKKAPGEPPARVEEREGPVPASPATRRLARELGVDLRQVPAGGPEGRVTAEDVRRFAEEGPPPEEEEAPPERREPPAPAEVAPLRPSAVPVPELPDFESWGQVERTPLRSVRRATARQMALSWSQIPHVTHYDQADITELERFRNKHKQHIKEQGGSLTPTIFAIKAAVAALKQFPRFNASLDVEAQEIVLKQYYHIGIAVDTERGLIVPVMRDADQKSLTQLSMELVDLVERTREGQIGLDELQGGTFTITNIGILGGTGFSPIINYPEVAILGMAQAGWEPAVVTDEEGERRIEPRYILPLVLTFDHRVLDGADAARFMRTVVEALQSPDRLLLTM